MNPIPWIKSFAWQIGAITAATALVVTSGFLIAAQVENNRIVALNQELDNRISNPKTGLVVSLAQAQTNAETVKVALTRQVDDLKIKAENDRKALAATTRLLAAAQVESSRARRQSADLMRADPKGATLEARVLDVDAKVLEMLQ